MPGKRSPEGPPWLDDVSAPGNYWRRLASEAVGTFFLVLAAAGGEAVATVAGGEPSHAARAVAPGLTVMAFILATGAVSGAHFNPAVTLGFALRRDFPWRRVPGYVLVQLVSGGLACLLIEAVVPGTADRLAVTNHHVGLGQAFATEVVLTFGLVTVILGTASAAQNVGNLSALGVGGYIALAGLWAGPITGAIMNPARALGPFVLGQFGVEAWSFVVAQLLGAVLAVGLAWVLRGPGGDQTARKTAEGKAA